MKWLTAAAVASASARNGGGVQRRRPNALRVRLRDLLAQSLAAELQHEAVVLDRVHGCLHARHVDGVEHLDQRHALLRRDATRAPVDDHAVPIDGAEVAPRRHLAGRDGDADAQRLQHAPADEVLHRVVAEEAEVARPAARRDARQHRRRQPARAHPREPVQVGRRGRLKLGLAGVRVRQPAETVGHQHDDLGRRLADDVRQRGKIDHCRLLMLPCRGGRRRRAAPCPRRTPATRPRPSRRGSFLPPGPARPRPPRWTLRRQW